MKKITKLVLTFGIVLFAGNLFAQDVTFGEVFNKANDAYRAGNELEAVEGFREALKLADEAGDEGLEISETCKDLIPSILLSAAANRVKANDYEGAYELFEEAEKAATEYGKDNVAASASEKLTQVSLAMGANALNSQDFETAIKCFKEVTEKDNSNATAYLYLGMAEGASGKTEDAETSLKKAIELGDNQAGSILSNLYMAQLAEANKAKDYATTVEVAEKINELGTNEQACLFGGMAAYQLKQYSKAIALLKNATGNNAYYYLAKAYEDSGNNSQACVYYKKIQNDAKFGAYAKSKITALKC